MKNFKTFAIAFGMMLTLTFVSVSSCSSDDGGSRPELTSACELTGEIKSDMVGTWTGELYFNSNNSTYKQTTQLKADGTFYLSGPGLKDTHGCWRVTGTNIGYVGTYNHNGGTITGRLSGRVVNQDSIVGNISSSDGETGTLWMTR